jgi:UDP-N-acetylglucosamine 2-epimerase
MKRLLLVVGTRPNCIKVTRFKKTADALFNGCFDIKRVHTGQYFDKHDIVSQINSILNGTYIKVGIPEFWDGKATERILEILS